MILRRLTYIDIGFGRRNFWWLLPQHRGTSSYSWGLMILFFSILFANSDSLRALNALSLFWSLASCKLWTLVSLTPFAECKLFKDELGFLVLSNGAHTSPSELVEYPICNSVIPCNCKSKLPVFGLPYSPFAHLRNSSSDFFIFFLVSPRACSIFSSFESDLFPVQGFGEFYAHQWIQEILDS